MQEQLLLLDRSRRRWRAIALALALAHVITLVFVGFLVYWLRATEARMHAETHLHRALMLEAVRQERMNRVHERAAAKAP